MPLSGLEIGDAEVRQSIFTLEQNVEVGEQFHSGEHHVGAMRDQLFPVFASGSLYWCSHQPEISSRIVDANEELFAVMIDLVFLVLHPWRNQIPFALRLIGTQVAPF